MSRPPSVTDIAFELAREIQGAPHDRLALLEDDLTQLWASIPTLAALKDVDLNAFMWAVKRKHPKEFNTHDFKAQIAAERERNGTERDYGGDWHELLDRQGKFGYKGHLLNASIALRSAPELAKRLTLNDFSRKVIVAGMPWDPSQHEWGDNDSLQFATWLQKEAIYVSKDIARDAAMLVSRDNRIHPVREYLQSLKWDGVARLDFWLRDYLGVREESIEQGAYFFAVGARWMQSAVARIMEPGCQADHCLVIEGPQGVGKSTALSVLAVRREWFTDQLPDLHSKAEDASAQLAGMWIVEISEFEGFTRADVATVKQFITRRQDRYRKKYTADAADFARQCVFAATYNPGSKGPFSDETGNRRFWPVFSHEVNLSTLERDRDQLWAEAFERYRAFRAGEEGSHPWYLDDDNLVRVAVREQSDRCQTDPWEDTILPFLEGRSSDTVRVTDCLTDSGCLNLPNSRLSQLDQNRVARILLANGWNKTREDDGTGTGRRVWVYRRPGRK